MSPERFKKKQAATQEPAWERGVYTASAAPEEGKLKRRERRAPVHGPNGHPKLEVAASPELLAFAPRLVWLLLLAMIGLPALNASSDTLVSAKDGSGVRGYKDTPKLPWCEWLVHDADRPAPPRVNPGPAMAPAPVPADATVLFGGLDTSRWQSNDWRVADGAIIAGSGNLSTKESFSSCQLHIEWMTPTNFTGHLFDRGNNGVMLMGLFEIQIFDSFNEKLYADGQAAAIYAQTPPLVNACRPPGEWQSYDLVFTAPVFAEARLVSPARVTLLHNGVLVQKDEVIHGETGHRILPEYKSKATRGPLVLSAHNCPVRFRNIWIRPLTP